MTLIKDRDKLFSLYAELAHVTKTVSSDDLSTAKAWVNAAEDFHHSTTLLTYEMALRLLVHHLVGLPPLRDEIPYIISCSRYIFGIPSRIGLLEKLLSYLNEAGGVFWSQLTRPRSSLGGVVGPGLAGRTLVNEFARSTSVIRTAFDSPSPDQHDRGRHLSLELQRVVCSILHCERR